MSSVILVVACPIRCATHVDFNLTSVSLLRAADALKNELKAKYGVDADKLRADRLIIFNRESTLVVVYAAA